MRADKYLVEQNYFATREKAAFAIKKGWVLVNDLCIKKTSFIINHETDKISILEDDVLKYVSRGGLKLEKAILDFNLDFTNKKVLDIGSSTGGFTDCALQNGAVHVTAVDVGSNQMDAKLRLNDKINLFENIDFRELKPNLLLYNKFDFVLSDVSFISITKIFPFVKPYLDDDSDFVCLIKPQFEAGKGNIGRDGIVKSIEVHIKVIDKIKQECTIHGLYLNNLTIAPIHFKKKNIEYLAIFNTSKKTSEFNTKSIVFNAFKIKARL